jgi:hypothetical protein
MFKKGSSYMADWRNASGHRIRKAFPTAKAARAHQLRQQHAATTAKKLQATATLAKPSRPSKQAATTRAPRRSRPHARSRKSSKG